jgi:hypothetical protein
MGIHKNYGDGSYTKKSGKTQSIRKYAEFPYAFSASREQIVIHKYSTLKIEVVLFTETSVTIYQNTRLYIPDDILLHSYGFKNFTSCTILSIHFP